MAFGGSSSSSGTSSGTYPISRSFAFLALAALVALALLRHLFGSIRIEAGTR